MKQFLGFTAAFIGLGVMIDMIPLKVVVSFLLVLAGITIMTMEIDTIDDPTHTKK